jgi:hypothetical protein
MARRFLTDEYYEFELPEEARPYLRVAVLRDYVTVER